MTSVSSRFAATTQGLPGPTILAHFGTVWVPKATAATLPKGYATTVRRDDRITQVRLVHLQAIASADPNSPALRDLLAMAQAFIQSERKFAAAAVLRIAASKQPESTNVRLELGSLMLQAGMGIDGGPPGLPGGGVGPGVQQNDLLHAAASGHVEHAQHLRASLDGRRQRVTRLLTDLCARANTTIRSGVASSDHLTDRRAHGYSPVGNENDSSAGRFASVNSRRSA